MPCLVTFGFLLYAACKRFGDIDSGLVCDAEKYPKDICYFFFDIIFFSLLKGLVAILARHNSCQFTYFFGADMKVELLNDGPVTICMDTKNKE